MNRIVRERYPVSKLPEDLRKEFPGQEMVTLVVEGDRGDHLPDDEPSLRPDRLKTLDELFALAKPTFKSLDEVAAHVRSTRDEWT